MAIPKEKYFREIIKFGDPKLNNFRVKCFFCKEELPTMDNRTWIEGQTSLEPCKCEKCGKISCIKIFTQVRMNMDTEAKIFVPTIEYQIFTTSENKLRQGIGSRCSGPNCSQILYTKVIDQEKFINKEMVTCSMCGTTNEIDAASPTIRDEAKSKRIGEWITQTKIQNKMKQNAKKNLERFHNTFNNGCKVKPIETKNSFEALLQYDEENHDTGTHDNVDGSELSSVISNNSRKRRGPSIPHQNSKRGHAKILKDTVTLTPAVDVPTENAALRKLSTYAQTQHSSPSPGFKAKPTNPSSNNTQPIIRTPPIICTSDDWLDSEIKFKQLANIAKLSNSSFRADRKSGKILFYPKDLKARHLILEELKTNTEIEYYTFGTKQERKPSKKLVAKGLITAGYTEQEIISDVETRYGIKPERAIPMKNSTLILIFNGETNMRDVKTITHILHQKITIENYKVKLTAVTQCKNCFDFGHAKAHCGKKARNDTVSVDNDEGQMIDVCSSCLQPGHNARQARCPIFQNEIKKQQERRTKFADKNNTLITKPTNTQTSHKVIPQISFSAITKNDTNQSLGIEVQTQQQQIQNNSLAISEMQKSITTLTHQITTLIGLLTTNNG